MKKFLFFAAFATAMFTGCSNDNEIESADASVLGEIGFRAYTSKGETKAGATTGGVSGNFSNFKVYGNWNDGTYKSYIVGQIVEKSGSDWIYSPKRFWPASGDVDFYAYSPATSVNVAFTNTLAAPTFVYTIPVAFNQQEDLLVAKKKNAGSGDDAGAVTLPFDHALSQFVFEARGVVDGLNYTVNKIELLQINSTATFDYAAVAPGWGSYATPTTYTVLDGAPVNVAYHATDYTTITSDAANTAFMVIPGAWENGDSPADSDPIKIIPASGDGADWGYVGINFSITDATGMDYNNKTTWYVPIEVSPALNARYIYQFDLGKTAGNLVELKFKTTISTVNETSVVTPIQP